MGKPADHLVVPPERDGERLDRLVASLASVGSRRRAREAVESGKVDVGGATCREPGAPVPAGADVQVHWSRPGTSAAALAGRRHLDGAGLVVLYEDHDLLALDKPAGLLTDTATRQQARERDSVKKRLKPLLRARGQQPWVVHRLDRDTSGVVLVAREEAVSVRLRSAFARHEPERVYLAVVHGDLRPDRGEWTDLMAWDGKARIQRAVGPSHEGAVQARAHYEVLARLRGATLVAVRLHTGRRNQIRLHAMLRGHPLVGERLYVPRGFSGLHAPRQALHALRLGLRHPVTGDPLDLRAPVPADLRDLVRGLGGSLSEDGSTRGNAG